MQHGFLPDGEHVRRAVRWIANNRDNLPARTPLQLVGEAAFRFDLSPREEEWLLRTFGSPAREQAQAQR